MDVIFETLSLLVFSYPGAGIRWLVSRLWNSKKTFKEFNEDNTELNGVLGIFVIATPIILYNLI